MDNFDRKYKTKKVTIFGQNHRLITSFENISQTIRNGQKRSTLGQNHGLTPLKKSNFSTLQHRYFCSREMLVSYVEQIQRLFYRLFWGEI